MDIVCISYVSLPCEVLPFSRYTHIIIHVFPKYLTFICAFSYGFFTKILYSFVIVFIFVQSCFNRQNACISSIFYVSYFPQTTLSSLSSLFTHTCPVTVFILLPQHCFFRLLSLRLCYNVHISLLILFFEHITARTYFHSYPSIMMTKYVNI